MQRNTQNSCLGRFPLKGQISIGVCFDNLCPNMCTTLVSECTPNLYLTVMLRYGQLNEETPKVIGALTEILQLL